MWTCAQTNPGARLTALHQLSRGGFPALAPVLAGHDKYRHSITREVFPSYIFVELSPATPQWQRIQYTPGILHVLTRVGAADQPAEVPQGFIRQLQDATYGIPSRALPIGTRVKVLHGILADREELVKWSSEDRVRLLFLILGHEVEIEIDIGDVAVV